jgi:hypothetical protein
VAVDATARLYDVDEDSVVFSRLDKTKKYDQGTVTFRARKGKLIDLDKFHESVWASRLSGGTRSGLVSLEVTVVGRVVTSGDSTVLKVEGTNKEFVLGKHSDAKYTAEFSKLQKLSGKSVVKISGLIDNYRGRWPSVLSQKPPKTRRILITSFATIKTK